MTLFVVHSESLRRRWLAPLCSIACALSCLLVCGAAVFPLYIAWASGPFWIKDAVRFEQPRVSFSGRLVLQLHGSRGPLRAPFSAMWTSSADANARLVGSDALRAMVVRASSRDDNLDGAADELLVSASLPLADDEVVTGATVAAYFDAALVVSRTRALALALARASARARASA
jgi:hypothetical protein